MRFGTNDNLNTNRGSSVDAMEYILSPSMKQSAINSFFIQSTNEMATSNLYNTKIIAFHDMTHH